MGAVDEPWLVTEQFVQFIDVFEFLWYALETQEPGFVPFLGRELQLLLMYEKQAFVSGGGHDG